MTQEAVKKIIDHLRSVFLGQDKVVKALLCAFFAGGHVLLEGVPGIGKTLIGLSLARLLDLNFKRIQFTKRYACLRYNRVPYIHGNNKRS